MTERDREATAPAPTLEKLVVRAAYEGPSLRFLGDIRAATLGASTGAIESGATRTFRR